MRMLSVTNPHVIAVAFAVPLFLTIASEAHAQGLPNAPMRPVNPAFSVPYPPDTGVCESGSEKALRLVQNVGAQCMKELGDNKNDYAWLAAQMLAQVWVPGAREWVMEEFSTKFGKDATVCVLTGLVEFGGGSPQLQSFVKASIKELREISDRKKYYEKASGAWDSFSKYGREQLLTSKDHAKFLTFIDKKTFDRLKGAAKEASLIGAALNLDDPAYKTKTLVPEAREALNACSMAKAAASIQAAEDIHMDWLRQLRGDISRQKQALRCMTEEHRRNRSMMTRAEIIYAIGQSDMAKSNIERLEKLDAAQVAALQETADLKANIERRARVVDETLRKPFNATKAQVEQAFAACDYGRAEALIKELQRYTRDPQCQGELKSEYYRELELQNELQARLAKRAEAEQLVSRRFNDAMAKTDEDCKALGEVAGYLAILTKNVCIDQKAVQTKIGQLNDAAEACRSAKSGAPDAASAVLTMKEPVLDDKKYWPGTWDHNVGSSHGEYYPGEYLSASTHSWTAPPASVGPQGFPIKLTVECETGPKQGAMYPTTAIQVKGFQLVKSSSDHTPLEEKNARVDVTCPAGGGTNKNSLTVWVLPFPRYDDGAEAYIKVGGGPKVTFPYVAGRPKQ